MDSAKCMPGGLLIFLNSKVVPGRSMTQCFFVSFPRLKSALFVVREKNDCVARPLTCVNPIGGGGGGGGGFRHFGVSLLIAAVSRMPCFFINISPTESVIALKLCDNKYWSLYIILLMCTEIQCHKGFHLKPKAAINYTEISLLICKTILFFNEYNFQYNGGKYDWRLNSRLMPSYLWSVVLVRSPV